MSRVNTMSKNKKDKSVKSSLGTFKDPFLRKLTSGEFGKLNPQQLEVFFNYLYYFGHFCLENLRR